MNTVTPAPSAADDTARPAPVRAPRRPWWRSRALVGLAYASPTAVIVVVLFLVPLVMVFWMSLNRWPLLGNPTMNFPADYTRVGDNDLFRDSVWFTLKYTLIITVLLSGAALGLALLVQERRPGTGFYRTAFFLPCALGFASASLLFYGFFSNSIGPLDPMLRGLGIVDEPVAWIGTPGMALFSTITLVLWRFAGFNMLILLTGLQSIPVEVYEAARVDGASRRRVFLHITLPLLRPAIALMLVLTVTGSLLAFDQFFIFTQGGPDNSTLSMVMVIYREAFFRFDLGSAAALSVVVLGVLVVLNLLQLRVLRRWTGGGTT
ncbi:carbohydrate ABC transporter permease [Spirillospora sp. CA-142024]|uniref:carbohydrate ABC transporter permease n=1 Tax=Spirillospora sp. CA-142024 TaxID=3240036 RepID=UPI003D8F4515